MHKHMNRHSLLVLTVALLLPGCLPFSWIKHKVTGGSCCGGSSSDQTLLSINGKAVITEQSLEQEVQSIFEKRPEYKQFNEINPKHFRKLFFDEKKKFILAEEWAKRHHKDKTPEFKEAFDQARKHICMVFLQQSLLENMQITDQEATEFYDKSEFKSQLKAPAGVQALSVEFADEKSAALFFNRVKDPKADFAALARAMQKEVTDLGLVTEHSYQVNKALKTRLLAVHAAPEVGLVKAGDKSFFVFKVTQKRATAELSFDELDKQKQDALKNMMKQERFNAALEQTFEEISKESHLIVNEAFFSEAAPQETAVTAAHQDAAHEDAAHEDAAHQVHTA